MLQSKSRRGYEQVAETELPGGPEVFGELKVLDAQGRKFSLMRTVAKCATVGELKEEVARVSDVTLARQRLIYGGKVLHPDDAGLVEGFGVQDHTVIHLFQRPETTPGAVPEDAAVDAAEAGEADPAAQANPDEATASLWLEASELAAAQRLELLRPVSPALQDSRRRVRVLANLLTLLSTIFAVSAFFEIVDLCFDGPPMAFVRAGLRLLVNLLGMRVGRAGMEAVRTLDRRSLQVYCFGLILVAFCYLVGDLVLVWQAAQATNNAVKAQIQDDQAGSEPTVVDEQPEDDEAITKAQANSILTQVCLSMLVSCFIWGICLYRVFTFRRLLATERDGSPAL